MPRITAEELLERTVDKLKEKESEKKKELLEIQDDLKRRMKALEILGGNSAGKGKTKFMVK